MVDEAGASGGAGSVSADRELARRDPSLPGLALVLDGEAIARRLGHAAVDLGVRTVEARYTRYKPGGSCLVFYRLSTRRGELWAHAKAFRSDARAKALKAHAMSTASPGFGVAGSIHFPDERVVVTFFPNDHDLPALARLAHDGPRSSLLARIAPTRPDLARAPLDTLAYKPERRYVGHLAGDEGSAVIRLYSRGEFMCVAARARAHDQLSRGPLRLCAPIAVAARKRVVITGWLPGTPLDTLLSRDTVPAGALEELGAALARFHATPVASVPVRTRVEEILGLRASAESVGVLCPRLGARAALLGRHLCQNAAEALEPRAPIHGDLTADQVVIDPSGIGLIDLDALAAGDPAADIASFAAELIVAEIEGRLDLGQAEARAEELVAGYLSGGGVDPRQSIGWRISAELLRRAVDPFRRRSANWPTTMERVLERATECQVVAR